ncbi:MAG: hypothetical protein CVT49_07095 [candidate division Zixibacteria bacterium HGW-Zixibacteria-1]|nr:MAG: hypothetical protein CVT49_07095 [candidate division Zixibacteria bacterium HGW-Zixibacteria-1]
METNGTFLDHNGTTLVRKQLLFLSVEGAFATVFITVTGGAFLTGLALLFGANDFHIGLLAAIPFLAQSAQIVSAYFSDRTGQRKRMAVWNSAVARQIWWLMLPVIFFAGNWRLEAMILIVIISNIATMLATAGWLSWIADLVPEKIRGRYLGNRSAAVAIATMTATILGGIILDEFRAIDRENSGFAVIIAAGCLFALAAVILLNRLPDRPPETIKTDVSWSYFLSPLKDRNFTYLIKIFFYWNFALGISASFFAPHMLINLDMSFTLISIYSSVAALAAILLNKPWGILIDRFGSKPVAVFCAFGIAVVPMLWLVPRPGHLGILAFEAVYSGALWAGFNLAAFNIPIANSPRKGRTIYLAMFSVVTGLAFFMSSIIGGILAESWHHIHWPIMGQTIVNYHILFVISGLMRLIAAFFIMTFHEPKEKSFPIMIQFMGYSILKWLSVGRQILPGNRKR